MITVGYTHQFIKGVNRLEQNLQEEVQEKVELFKDERNHKALKVHKLKGRLAGRWAFSVNYKTRIIFHFLSKEYAVLLAIGDHDIYN